MRGDGDRYALHPLIRRFAAGRLADDPAAETAARDRHAAHFASVMQGLQGLEGGITEGEARWAAERALPDAIAAWRWSVERGAEENLVRLLTFMRSALNAMGRNALIDELIVTGLARVGPLSSAAARLKLALAQQVIHLDRRKARGLATAAAAAAAASDDVVSEGLAVLTLAATEDPSRGLESTRPLVRAALGRLREARSWELVASSYRALAVAEPSPRRHGALLALGMRYMRRFGFLSASTALSYYLGSHLTDTCGDHRAALAVTLEHLRSELDGAARPYALVAIHSLVAYYSLNAGDLDAARQHHEEALELTGRRAEAPEPVYWSPETHWVAWAAPLVALHTAGPGHALRSGRDQLEPREVRDLLAHAMLACGDREGALAAADRWRRRAASLPVVRFRVLARPVIVRAGTVEAAAERLQARLQQVDAQVRPPVVQLTDRPLEAVGDELPAPAAEAVTDQDEGGGTVPQRDRGRTAGDAADGRQRYGVGVHRFPVAAVGALELAVQSQPLRSLDRPDLVPNRAALVDEVHGGQVGVERPPEGWLRGRHDRQPVLLRPRLHGVAGRAVLDHHDLQVRVLAGPARDDVSHGLAQVAVLHLSEHDDRGHA